VDTYSNIPPIGTIQADHKQLEHINTYGFSPIFYINKPFECRDCGAKEIWTAKQQKWWYEVAKGYIDSTAIRCRRCRDIIKNEKARQKQHMEEMAKKKPLWSRNSNLLNHNSLRLTGCFAHSLFGVRLRLESQPQSGNFDVQGSI
jgi:hypothetical protein